MMQLLRTWRAGAALIVAALAVACGGEPAKKAPPATPVRVSPAVRMDAPVNILASGVVEPLQTVAVTAQVSGSLLDVLFSEGDFVQAGQVLFRVDPRPLNAAVDQARANLARDEAQANAAEKDDVRYAKLAEMGYVSRSQADQMHAAALAAAASAEANRAALRSAQVSLGFATIRAPIAGRTGSLLVRKGNNVSPGGNPLVVINQIAPVLVRFPVLEQDFASIQRAVASHPLTVVAMSNDSTQASEHGQLSFLDNSVDSLTGTVTGKANFPNTGRRLWPGELVFLTVQLDVQRNVIAVPNEAVLTGQQGSYVYIVDAKQTAQTRNVVTGLQVADMTVISKGVAVGERVVIDGQSRLNPGGKVSMISTGTDTGTSRMNGDATQGGANGDMATGRAGASGSAAATGTAGADAGNGGRGTGAGNGDPNGAGVGNGNGNANPAPTNGQSNAPRANAPTTGVAPTAPTAPGMSAPRGGAPTTTGRPPGGARTPAAAGAAAAPVRTP